MIKTLIDEQNVSLYELSKKSGIAYSTLSDLYNGKTNIKKCNIRTAYALSHALNMSLDDLMEYIFKD